MKTFPALYIDPQGVVRYIPECPEKPTFIDTMEWVENCLNDRALREYERVLAAAKQSAIEVQNREQVIREIFNRPVTGVIHPLPTGWKVEKETYGVCCSPMPEYRIRHHGYCDECNGYTEKQVAILTPDPIPDSGNKVESQTIEQYFRACYGTDDPRTMKFDGRDMMDFAEAWAVKEANDLQKENSDLRAQLGRVKKGELRLEAAKERLLRRFGSGDPNARYLAAVVCEIIEEEIEVKPRHKKTSVSTPAQE